MTRACLLSDDLVELSFDSQAAAEAAAGRFREEGAWLEVVTGVNTVTVQFDCLGIEPTEALALLSELRDEPLGHRQDLETAEIPVCYSADMAPDLEAVCRHLGIDADELVRLHTSSRHHVRMLGFAPGFAYVDGLDPRLDVPRHETPRQSVPAGSVAIAGGQTGIYSLASPGGWQVIGRTPTPLFDANRRPPTLLQPGQPIRFHPISVDEFEALRQG